MAIKKKKNHGSSYVNHIEAAAKPKPRAGVELKLTSFASMYINTGNSQNQGARPYQEDSFGYSNIIDSSTVSGKGILAVLSDGMGGLSNGKNVADYVVQTSIAMFEALNPYKNISEQLENIAQYINKGVCDKYAAEEGSSKAGATMVFVYIFKNRIYWITVGDSRLYCLRNGNMIQMNEDHDYKNRLFRDYINDGGSLAEIEQDAQKDSLVSFIGKKELSYTDVSLRGYRIKTDDIFILCSDGIYNGISIDAMKDILLQNDAQTASDNIVSTVLSARFPGQDNMTVMVIKCE